MLRAHTCTALSAVLVITSLALNAPPVSAHAGLETRSYPAGANAKLVMHLSHGCEGSPTISVRIRIPDNVLNVKPQPKPGWQVTTVKGALTNPIKGQHGETITESVREIQWSGGRLEDKFYDEFVFRAQLPDLPGTTLYIPVVQECETGAHRWIETPEAGKTRRDYKSPAPELRLLPKQQ